MVQVTGALAQHNEEEDAKLTKVNAERAKIHRRPVNAERAKIHRRPVERAPQYRQAPNDVGRLENLDGECLFDATLAQFLSGMQEAWKHVAAAFAAAGGRLVNARVTGHADAEARRSGYLAHKLPFQEAWKHVAAAFAAAGAATSPVPVETFLEIVRDVRARTAQSASPVSFTQAQIPSVPVDTCLEIVRDVRARTAATASPVSFTQAQVGGGV
ncbi:hypothetical protein T484DRAFT_1803081 [Baffinella frigidus]|nr:hypothetical protein T484DRAFT_1803081 [Cryptophyta sp. CCMP2293]